MKAMLSKIIGIILLLAFISIQTGLMMVRFFRKGMTTVLGRVIPADIPENEKKSWEIIYTIVWLVIGLWALWELKDKTILGAFFGFFAFRGGANVGKLVIYSRHDAKLVERLGSGRVLEMISTVTKLSLLLESLFLAALAFSYKALSVTLKGGGTAGRFLLLLWLGGFIFGTLFGLFIARNNRGILLKDSLSTLAFFTMRKVSVKTSSASEKLKDNVLKRLPK
ncbi:hypothetical protein [Thermococcus sp. Bubb.Bath]|uniref:hypothetical protein n=1 Tax=Thermococcus sp. Bubb.Bath TaxID=1638242 RepID=UPI00143B4737|nr:hypothetical protein [Thermococcus sp. Bubb.Bath]NJF25036.1 hypothetical protein [Thermococcus sp. Bubb.Bath]